MFAIQHEKLNSGGLLDTNGIYIFSDSRAFSSQHGAIEFSD